MVCGGATKSSKGQSVLYPFRYTNTMDLLTSLSGTAMDINNSGDLLLGTYIYQDGWGFLKLSDLIDTTDPDAARYLKNGAGGLYMNDRLTGPGFGQIAGSTAGQPFLLRRCRSRSCADQAPGR